LSKILIIEDDEDTAEMLGLIVDYLTIDVVSSPKVLPVSDILAISPDLILLDHWVGSGLGGDLCFKLKSNPATRDTPVIMVSAHNKIAQIAERSQADAFLAKPFNLDELTDLIERFVPKPAQ